MHEKVCLWFSGGDDSRLLLEILLEITEPEIDDYGKPIQPFGVLCFDLGWTREQRKHVDAIIIKHNLQVFSYPATATMFIANNTDAALVTTYPIDRGGHSAVILQDIVHEPGRCILDPEQVNRVTMPNGPASLGWEAFQWDAHLWGTRRSDTHWSLEVPFVPSSWQNGSKVFYAPLMLDDWTDERVQEAIESYGAEPALVDTGDLHACANCLIARKKVFCPKVGKKIPPVKWDRDKNLQVFHQILRRG